MKMKRMKTNKCSRKISSKTREKIPTIWRILILNWLQQPNRWVWTQHRLGNCSINCSRKGMEKKRQRIWSHTTVRERCRLGLSCLNKSHTVLHTYLLVTATMNHSMTLSHRLCCKRHAQLLCSRVWNSKNNLVTRVKMTRKKWMKRHWWCYSSNSRS